MDLIGAEPLVGTVARLEPLAASHAPAIAQAGADPSIWRWLPRGPFHGEADARAWVFEALAARDRGEEFPWAIVHSPTGRVAGSTRYLSLRLPHRGLEIGWTWIAPEFQRTPLNTECKLLLLTHAFEALGCMRVEFKTDHRNEKSQRAIERLGAVREGVFRKHRVCPDGSIRHSVYYSITDDEWPGVKAKLSALLQ